MLRTTTKSLTVPLVLLCAASVAACGAAESQAETGVDGEVALSRIIADVEAAASEGNYAPLCDEAPDPEGCQQTLIDLPERATPQPGVTRWSVRTLDDGSQVADLSGPLLNGKTFDVTIELVNAKGEGVPISPLYWVETE